MTRRERDLRRLARHHGWIVERTRGSHWRLRNRLPLEPTSQGGIIRKTIMRIYELPDHVAPDVLVDNHGSIIVLHSLSAVAEAWFEVNLAEGASRTPSSMGLQAVEQALWTLHDNPSDAV